VAQRLIRPARKTYDARVNHAASAAMFNRKSACYENRILQEASIETYHKLSVGIDDSLRSHRRDAAR
jgi:hypothetical protein